MEKKNFGKEKFFCVGASIARPRGLWLMAHSVWIMIQRSRFSARRDGTLPSAFPVRTYSPVARAISPHTHARCMDPVPSSEPGHASGGLLSCSGKKVGKEPAREGEDSESLLVYPISPAQPGKWDNKLAVHRTALSPPWTCPSFKRPNGARPFWISPQNRILPAFYGALYCNQFVGTAPCRPPFRRGDSYPPG